MPTIDDLRNFLTQRQVRFDERAVQSGTQFICSGGEVFTHYDPRGKVVPGGTTTALTQEVIAWTGSGFVPSAIAVDDQQTNSSTPSGLHNDIFVVYGRDVEAREQLELLLHKMKLNPVVLANLTPDGDTIIEKLEKYLLLNNNIGFACVILTPDDEGYLAGDSDGKKYRARQNVILELGMVLARLGRPRVAILRKHSVEDPSDINGLIYLPFEERVDEVKSTLFRCLEEAGYHPNRGAL